jgi:hypothetical protein
MALNALSLVGDRLLLPVGRVTHVTDSEVALISGDDPSILCVLVRLVRIDHIRAPRYSTFDSWAKWWQTLMR